MDISSSNDFINLVGVSYYHSPSLILTGIAALLGMAFLTASVLPRKTMKGRAIRAGQGTIMLLLAFGCYSRMSSIVPDCRMAAESPQKLERLSDRDIRSIRNACSFFSVDIGKVNMPPA